MRNAGLHGPAIGRRGFLALGGAGLAGAAVAGCGTEKEGASPERDVELLGDALAAERALARTYRFAEQTAAEQDAAVLSQFRRAAEAHSSELSGLIEDQGGAAEAGEMESGGGTESALEGAVADLGTAIGAYREAAALLSTRNLKRTAYELLADDAAQLAALHRLVGEREAPEAFVTGGEEPPLVSPEPVEEDE